jgi:hypothetical protein
MLLPIVQCTTCTFGLTQNGNFKKKLKLMNQNKFTKSKVTNLPKISQNLRDYIFFKRDFTIGTLDNKSPKISCFTSIVNSVNFVTICYMVISILRQ